MILLLTWTVSSILKITDKWSIYEFSNLKTKKELTLYSKTKTPKGQEEVKKKRKIKKYNTPNTKWISD